VIVYFCKDIYIYVGKIYKQPIALSTNRKGFLRNVIREVWSEPRYDSISLQSRHEDIEGPQ